jgi:hypothetical protein
MVTTPTDTEPTQTESNRKNRGPKTPSAHGTFQSCLIRAEKFHSFILLATFLLLASQYFLLTVHNMDVEQLVRL